MKKESNGIPATRYLSAMWQRAARRFRYQSGEARLSSLPEPQHRVSLLVECRRCGLAYIDVQSATAWDAGDSGFAVFNHCGIRQRTASLSSDTLRLLREVGTPFHPSSRPARLTHADYAAFAFALTQTDTPQEELL